MLKSWRLGSMFGFPIEINLSFLLLLAVVFFAFGGAMGVFVVSLAFASVLLHELGHALVARQLGVHVSGIELSFFGGAAKMTDMPRVARHEIAIAAAGPAVSLMLGGLGLGLGALFQSPFVAMIGWINFVIAGFNLIPALPMDGGRILRALLTRKLDYIRATDVAVAVARVVAVGFVVIGIAASAYQLILLAPFLWLMGTREKQIARMAVDYHGHREYALAEHEVWPLQRSVGGRSWPHADPVFRSAPRLRRFTIRERNGRLVIESLD